VVGFKAEAACLAGLLPPGQVHCSGADSRRARDWAQTLAAAGARGLLSFGIAGGLEPGLCPGALVLAEAVVRPDGRIMATDAAWTRRAAAALPGIRTGRIAGSDRAVASVADKQRLRILTGALAVDMESHALAAVAESAGLPLLVLRAVADPAERALPAPALVGIAADGSPRPLAVALRLLPAPWHLPGLIRLARDSEAALAALRQALRRSDPPVADWLAPP
jgi:hopanoid-associated phosphorylase